MRRERRPPHLDDVAGNVPGRPMVLVHSGNLDMGDLEMNAQPQTIEEKIAAKIDTESANSLTVSEKSGGLAFQNADQAMNFAWPS
jgi:hypothetical protein